MTGILIDVGWIQVIQGGAVRDVGLREAVRDAHEFEDLDWADPLVASSLMGLMLAIVREATGFFRAADIVGALGAGRFDGALIDAYFDAHADDFDLFHPDKPFFQVAGLEATSGGPKPVSLIVPEIATGNNVPLFSSVSESSVAPLSVAEAARRLISCQAWDTAAIKTGVKGDPKVSGGKTTGNPTGPLGQLGVVTVIGASLFETLVLNLPMISPVPGDRPAWAEPANPTWRERAAFGPLDLLTWQSRRVRLFPEAVDGMTVVTGVIVAAGDRLIPDASLEPRTAYRRIPKPKPGEAALRARRLHAGAMGWRGLASMVTSGRSQGTDDYVVPPVIEGLQNLVNDGYLTSSHQLSVQLAGVEYGNQSAVIENVLADRTPLPLVALDWTRGDPVRRLLEGMALQAAAVAAALNRLADNLRLASGGDKIPWDKGQRVGDRFVTGLEHSGDRVLAGLIAEPTKAQEAGVAWEQLLRRDAWFVAGPLLDSASPESFLGRPESKPRPGAETKKQPVMLRQQSAEAFFRVALNKALPSTIPPPRLPANARAEESA